MSLPHGLYDALSQRMLAAETHSAAGYATLDEESAVERLTDVLKEQLARNLDESRGNERGQVAAQLDFVNGLLRHVRDIRCGADELVDLIDNPARLLRSVHPRTAAPEVAEVGG